MRLTAYTLEAATAWDLDVTKEGAPVSNLWEKCFMSDNAGLVTTKPRESWLGRHRQGLLISAALIGFLLLMQWPMIKGMGYRALGIPAPVDRIPWREDFAQALSESAISGKPVLISFTAAWCPPCQVMKHDVWPDEQVHQAVIAGYIPLRVDSDSPGSEQVAGRYGVSTIPTVLVVDSKGNVLKEGAFMSRKAMLRFLADKSS